MRLLFLLLILSGCAAAAPVQPAYTYQGGRDAAVTAYGSLTAAQAALEADHYACLTGSMDATQSSPAPTQVKLDTLYAACMAWAGWEKR